MSLDVKGGVILNLFNSNVGLVFSIVLTVVVASGPAIAGPVLRIAHTVNSDTYEMTVSVMPPKMPATQLDGKGTDTQPVKTEVAEPRSSPENKIYNYRVDWKTAFEVIVARESSDQELSDTRSCTLEYQAEFFRDISPWAGARDEGDKDVAARFLDETGLKKTVLFPLFGRHPITGEKQVENGGCLDLMAKAERKAAEVEGSLRNLVSLLTGLENLGISRELRAYAAGIDVEFKPLQTTTPIMIVGGNVDRVLFAIYQALHSVKMIEPRAIRAHVLGISLADHMYRARVLFSRYPALFDEFLANFDKRNSLATATGHLLGSKVGEKILSHQNEERRFFREIIETNFVKRAAETYSSKFNDSEDIKQLNYGPSDQIFVPDLLINIQEAPVTVTLKKGRKLSQHVRAAGLFRTINERTGRHIPLRENWQKVKQVLELNDGLAEDLELHGEWKLEATADTEAAKSLRARIGRSVADIDDRSLQFPADAIRLHLPNEVLERPPKTPEVRLLQALLDQENVFSVGTLSSLKPEIVDAASVEIAQDPGAAAVPPAQGPELFVNGPNCQTDHHAQHSAPHLKAIGTTSQNHKFFRKASGWVAVIDKFGIPEPLKHEKEKNRLLHKAANSQGLDVIIASNKAMSVFDLSDAQLEEQLSSWKNKDLKEFYLLEDFHDEFMKQPSGKAPIVASSNQHEFIEKDHGFHVSSVLAGRCNNYGVVGIAPKMKVHAYNGMEKSVDSKKAVEDYFKHSRKCLKPCIINASFSIPRDKKLTPLIVKALEDPKYTDSVLMIAAAGQRWKKNGAVWNNVEICKDQWSLETWRAPACLGNRPNVLTVTSAKQQAAGAAYQLQPDANYGVDAVWLAAPGMEVLGATSNPNHYSRQDGTSIAAAFVTGVTAVLNNLSKKKSLSLSPCQLKARLAYTADLNVGLNDKVKFGWLNAGRAAENFNQDVIILSKGPANERKRVGDLGFLSPEDYTEEGRIPLSLFLYEHDKDYAEDDKAPSILLSDVRRISRQPNGGFTVVYADSTGDGQPCANLKIKRDVLLKPRGEGRDYLGSDRVNHSFGIIVEKVEKEEDGTTLKKKVEMTTPLFDIQEVVVKASAK